MDDMNARPSLEFDLTSVWIDGLTAGEVWSFHWFKLVFAIEFLRDGDKFPCKFCQAFARTRNPRHFALASHIQAVVCMHIDARANVLAMVVELTTIRGVLSGDARRSSAISTSLISTAIRVPARRIFACSSCAAPAQWMGLVPVHRPLPSFGLVALQH
jgi:hypothetical protein